jgi:hypothetical protein
MFSQDTELFSAQAMARQTSGEWYVSCDGRTSVTGERIEQTRTSDAVVAAVTWAMTVPDVGDAAGPAESQRRACAVDGTTAATTAAAAAWRRLLRPLPSARAAITPLDCLSCVCIAHPAHHQHHQQQCETQAAPR